MKKIFFSLFLFFSLSLSLNAQVPIGIYVSSSTVKNIKYTKPETAVVGLKTQDKLHYVEFCKNITSPITYTQGNNIKILQTILRYQVYPNLGSTGFYGPVTQNVVKTFQKTYGIRQTGYVGPQTLAKMRSLWCNIDSLPEADLLSTPISIPSSTPPSDSISNQLSSTDRLNYAEFCENITSPITYTEGDNVKTLQTVLNKLYPSLQSTGFYGPVTEFAVQIFQKRYGIKTTGFVDTVTLSKMRDVWCNIKSSPEAVSPQSTPSSSTLPPTIILFDATPKTIEPGQDVTLNWSSINSDECILTSSAKESNTVSTSSTIVVNPTTNTTYTLTCSNAAGKSIPSSQRVVAGFSSSTISVTPVSTNVNYGSSINLTLTTTNMKSCKLNGGNFNNSDVSINGAISIVSTTSATYMISCTGKDGKAYATQSRIEVDKSFVLPRSITLSPNPATYTTPQNITITGVNTDFIRYTIDNFNPTCTTGNLYSAPITLSTNQTVKAIGCNSLGESQVVSGTYTINANTPKLPVFRLFNKRDSTSYPGNRIFDLDIISENSDFIRYTFYGDAPTCTHGYTTLPITFDYYYVFAGGSQIYNSDGSGNYYRGLSGDSSYKIKAIGCNAEGYSPVATSPIYTSADAK